MAKTSKTETPKAIGFSFLEISVILTMISKEVHAAKWFEQFLPQQADQEYIKTINACLTKVAGLIQEKDVTAFLEAFPHLHEAFGIPFEPSDAIPTVLRDGMQQHQLFDPEDFSEDKKSR